jgi:hypothetical protein
MQGVLVTPRAVLVEFQPARVVAAILLAGIVALFALGASERDNRANVFFRSHTTYLLWCTGREATGAPLLPES